MQLDFAWGSIQVDLMRVTRGDQKRMMNWGQLSAEEQTQTFGEFLDRVIVQGGDDVPIMALDEAAEAIVAALQAEAERRKNARTSSARQPG